MRQSHLLVSARAMTRLSRRSAMLFDHGGVLFHIVFTGCSCALLISPACCFVRAQQRRQGAQWVSLLQLGKAWRILMPEAAMCCFTALPVSSWSHQIPLRSYLVERLESTASRGLQETCTWCLQDGPERSCKPSLRTLVNNALFFGACSVSSCSPMATDSEQIAPAAGACVVCRVAGASS